MNHNLGASYQYVARFSTFCHIQHAARMFVHTVQQFKYAITIVIFIAVFLSPPLTSLATSPVASAQTPAATVVTRTDAETYYLQAVNAIRAEHKLPALRIDTRLTISATLKTSDMISQNYWGHYAPNGVSFADYVWSSSPAAYRVGENLARCFETRDQAFAALVASPTHHAIMDGEYTNFGVAELVDSVSGYTYTTMHFSFYD